MFIILGHLSSVFTSSIITYILQNISYCMAILVAIDSLSGNVIKNKIKDFCKKFKNGNK